MFKVLSKTERNLILLFIFIFFASIAFAGIKFYNNHTKSVPAEGGSYSEGIIGYPRYLNPVLAQTNDADRDLSRIIFSSLLKYDEQGNLIPDLAESYTIEDSGKTYNFQIKKNVFWHDDKQLTADDIIFTIQLIQDSSFKSPLRVNWQGVEVEKIDDFSVSFKLKNAYAPFLYNLTSGILPKHIWQNVSAADFALNENNLKPIGSGPYVFKKLEKSKDGTITAVQLAASKNYYLDDPFIDQLTFRFYADEDKAIAAWRKSEIQGLSYISPQNYAIFSGNQKNGTTVYSLNLPRYFAVFINQTTNKALADKNVRTALAYATDKNKLVNEVVAGFGQKIDSPILPGMLGYSEQAKVYEFDIEKAKNTLQAAGWIDANNDGIREKGGQNLEFTLSTTVWPELVKVTDILKDSWLQIGVKLNIETKDATSLQQENIRPREYQMLLFGEILNIDPDPFSFWHSSQKKDPGLNLSLYENAQVDAILQDARQDLNPTSRAAKYQQFSQIIADDIPAIFLYTPNYLYVASSNIKNLDSKILVMPSDRFSQIEKWYITTKRVWK